MYAFLSYTFLSTRMYVFHVFCKHFFHKYVCILYVLLYVFCIVYIYNPVFLFCILCFPCLPIKSCIPPPLPSNSVNINTISCIQALVLNYRITLYMHIGVQRGGGGNGPRPPPFGHFVKDFTKRLYFYQYSHPSVTKRLFLSIFAPLSLAPPLL